MLYTLTPIISVEFINYTRMPNLCPNEFEGRGRKSDSEVSRRCHGAP